MERDLKKVSLAMVMTEGEKRITVQAYTTPVGGLVVASRHSIVWENGNERIVKRKNNWGVWTYPVGLRVLTGFRERQHAIDFCEKHLGKYSWVALLKEDITKNNDMDAMRKDFMQYAQMVKAMYE